MSGTCRSGSILKGNIMTVLKRFFRESAGSVHIEYGMIALMISVGIISAAGSIGTSSNGSYNTIVTTLN